MGKFHKPQNRPVTIKQTEKGLPKLYCKTQRNLESPLFQAFFQHLCAGEGFFYCIKISRNIEPACGTGNFLTEILARKLSVVKSEYGRSPLEYEKYSLLAVSSLYGVDIMADNVETCRERLFKQWDKQYKSVCKKECNDDTRKSVRFILSRNIVCGNALTLKCVDENCNDTEQDIVFSEWAFVFGSNIQRSDYSFDELVNGNKEKASQLTLSDSTEGEGTFLRKYICNYRRLWENG